jgi:hypothetical protein
VTQSGTNATATLDTSYPATWTASQTFAGGAYTASGTAIVPTYTYSVCLFQGCDFLTIASATAAASGTTGATIQLGPGTFNVPSGGLKTCANNLTITGLGRGVTTLQYNGSNASSGIAMCDSTQRTVNIENLKISQNQTNPNGSSCLDYDYMTKSYFYNLTETNCAIGNFASGTGSNYNTWENIWALPTSTTANIGSLSGVNACWVSGGAENQETVKSSFRCQGSGATSTVGFYVHGHADTFEEDDHETGLKYGVYDLGYGNTWINPYFEDNATNFYNNPGTAYGTTIIDGFFVDSALGSTNFAGQTSTIALINGVVDYAPVTWLPTSTFSGTITAGNISINGSATISGNPVPFLANAITSGDCIQYNGGNGLVDASTPCLVVGGGANDVQYTDGSSLRGSNNLQFDGSNLSLAGGGIMRINGVQVPVGTGIGTDCVTWTNNYTVGDVGFPCLSTASASTLYYPLSSNPSGYLTAAITSINGDTSTAQKITGSGPITTSTISGVTTIGCPTCQTVTTTINSATGPAFKFTIATGTTPSIATSSSGGSSTIAFTVPPAFTVTTTTITTYTPGYQQLAATTTVVVASSSAAAIQVFSMTVPANTLGTNGNVIEIRASGMMLNASSTNEAMTVTGKYCGTAFAAPSTPTLTSSTNPGPWTAWLQLTNASGTTNTQLGGGIVSVVAGSNALSGNSKSMSCDSTQNQTLTLSLTNSVNSASDTLSLNSINVWLDSTSTVQTTTVVTGINFQ